MNEQFVPFEQAIALKKLGFNKPCFAGFYMEDNIYPSAGKLVDFNGRGEPYTSRPLWQQAFDWFREKHNLPSHVYTSNGTVHFCAILKEGRYVQNGHSIAYDTHKEAEIACLNKLIELIK